jgi:hypothetical protein
MHQYFFLLKIVTCSLVISSVEMPSMVVGVLPLPLPFLPPLPFFPLGGFKTIEIKILITPKII